MLENPFLYSLAITLVHFIWQGSLVALLLKLALTFTPARNPQLRYAFSGIAMLANLLLPLTTFFVVYHADLERITNNSEMITTLIKNISTTDESDLLANLVEYLPFLALFWLVSISYLSIKLLFDIHYVRQLTKVDIIATEKPLAQRFIQLADEMHLTRMPQLLISLKAEIPMAVGWLKPMVILPVAMLAGLSSAQLEMLLLHELAHIKRHDYLVNFIQTLVEILLFFHPAVRWVSTQMRNEREFCSDDIAVHHCCKPIAYARTLTETAALCQKHTTHSIPQMALAASGGDLKQRVIRLIDAQCTSSNDLGKWFAGIFLLVSLLLISSRQFLSLPILEDKLTYLPFYSSQTTVSSQQGINNVTANPTATTNVTAKYSPTVELLNANATSQAINDSTNLKKIATNKQTSDVVVVNAKSSGNFKRSIAAKNKEKNSARVLPKYIKVLNDAEQAKPQTVLANSIQQAETNKRNKAKANKNIASKKLPTVVETKHSAIVTSQNKAKKILSEDIAAPVPTTTTTNNHLKSILDKYKLPANPYAKQISALSQPIKSADTAIISTKVEQQTPLKKAAQLLYSYSPKYPQTAKRKKLELEVFVRFTVGTDGYVHNIVFDQQSKTSYFRRAIRSAMRKWHFQPAEINGDKVESSMSRIFSFSLKN
jgi:bla regulator protein blaR1